MAIIKLKNYKEIATKYKNDGNGGPISFKKAYFDIWRKAKKLQNELNVNLVKIDEDKKLITLTYKKML